MFVGPEINKLVAATLAASAAAGTDTATYLSTYKTLLLGLDKLGEEIELERNTAAMRRLNRRRADGMVA